MAESIGTRERLVRTSARLFLHRSYQSVGVDELCTAASVKKGSFYYFFNSKADLAGAVVAFHAEAFLGRLDRVDGDSPIADLHQFADIVGATQATYEERYGRVVGCPFGNLASELSTEDDELRRQIAQVFAEIQGRIVILAREALDKGLLTETADPDRFAKEFMAQFQGMILLAKVNQWGSGDVGEALHRLVEREVAKV